MTDTHVFLDDKELHLQYVVSPQVPVHIPAGNVLGVPGPDDGTPVSAGYWALVHPSKGKHTLEFEGTFPDFGFDIHLTYELTVV
jgi:hypothetical protein